MIEQDLTDGRLALRARRLALGPGEQGSPVVTRDGEAFLYVIAGSGELLLAHAPEAA